MTKTSTTTKPAKKARSKSRGRAKQKVLKGKIFIQSSYNNTIISVTDLAGNVLVQSSAGYVGFGGTRKATPYAAQRAVADVMERLQPFGMKEAAVYVKGIGSARESAVRALNAPGLAITSIRDVTPIPHNGVRARKKRRV
ncbi:MAG: 30S ribosomal protein S11 [Candidatus Andersenbacteria bacterium CG10_big_fil_rev_8_21_14_0_10_54_11]|uniref:Small ribosomal subunit protein uS11 n=1 Tax=Candidatus Andersenbacteria bacterium CG10_big_fil_rev_8_21_14_0_10_54_11 TaxID=1974485 RepID=A0A2M6WYE9_9BACT|nr:MAG: 30S ribosomal protein S11 [Candidatus Andersenbacteria bacterium CG10_big_fil_rev_8_21_14_0_10_54_11]